MRFGETGYNYPPCGNKRKELRRRIIKIAGVKSMAPIIFFFSSAFEKLKIPNEMIKHKSRK